MKIFMYVKIVLWFLITSEIKGDNLIRKHLFYAIVQYQPRKQKQDIQTLKKVVQNRVHEEIGIECHYHRFIHSTFLAHYSDHLFCHL